MTYIARIILFLLFLFSIPILSFEVIETQDTVEDTNLKVIKLLNNLTDDGVDLVDKTRGFNYRYSPLWYSPFKFDVYIGKFVKKAQGSIIRIESTRKGEEKILRSLFAKELNLNRDETQETNLLISKKNHFVTQSLNFVSPPLGIFYLGYKSPLYTNSEVITKMGLYFLIDAVIISLFAIYAENTVRTKSVSDRIFLKEGPDKLNLLSGDYSGLMFTFLAIPRVVRAIDSFAENSSNNRYNEFLNQKTSLELSYVIRY
jgi:hypothetical protein